MSERIQIETPSHSTVVFHASGASEPSVVPPVAPVVTGKESITASGSVSHPAVVGTTNGTAFSNPA